MAWRCHGGCGEGEGHHAPHKELARRLGITVAHSRKLIQRVTEKSLISGTQQGRAGGHLSPRAIQILNPDNTENQPS
jgi:hypothetical protein